MKALFVSLPLLLGLAATAAHAQQAQSLGSLRTTGPDLQRTVSVSDDGSITATINDGGLVSTLDVDLRGNIVQITKRNPWGIDSALVDLDSARKLLRDHPTMASAGEQALAYASSLGASHNKTESRIVPTAAGAAGCQSELDVLLAAADRVVYACANGGGFACTIASIQYARAKDAYNACVSAQPK
ncbi:hypothetical protein MBSD_n2763 [Mizugakiibacter sediminis]|uniref:Secreted protein n=1 Tax=Mizugakiibacter sediminis TaxID=1475481 RepID=A0A0K8QRA6_9GAMM|nr:hypothetical protein [Mizugakiibacter sediminis]GAP67438.1 hypothetical protein MBSD_n2763 [Mizugakiibacter sediminis]